MKFEITDLSPVRKTLTIELPAERVSRAFQRFSNEVARQVQIPGFRPGKAPLSLVRRHYQQDISERVMRQLTFEALNEAVDAGRLRIVGEPVVRELSLEDRAPFVLKLEVDVFPEFTVGPLEGLEGVKEIIPVTDADVERRLGWLRRATAQVEEVRDGSPIQAGDLVRVEVTGYALEEGATAPAETQAPFIPTHIQVVDTGAEDTRPEFTDALYGKVVGDETTAEVRYPSDDPMPVIELKGLPPIRLSGKRIWFRVKINAVFRPSAPPLDDAWAQSQFGMDLAALRARIRSELEAARERSAMDKLNEALLAQLIARSGVEAPPTLVTEQTTIHLKEWLRFLEQQGSPAPPDEELKKAAQLFRSRAETEVKQVLVLEQVAREAGVEVTEDELARAVAELADKAKLPPETMRARLTREDRLDTLRFELRSKKVLDIIRSAARVETRIVSSPDAPAPEETVSFPPENQ